MNQSKQLIQIIDNMLQIKDTIDFNEIKIITVIGRARLGKSSLLNIISAYVNGEEREVFKSSASIKHVTQGIQYYYYDKLKILIMDSQGLDYSDSSNDNKILLFCYSISDIIIYNDRNIFNNSSLNSLCQLTSFVNQIENITTKPILLIRIADYELDENINEIIQMTLMHQNDQYDNIRKAMTTLFSEIKGLHTNYLERSDIINMKEHKYTGILKNTTNNYFNCVSNIIDMTLSLKPKNININFLQLLVDNINNNKNINYHALDIYTQISKNQILEFMVAIPKDAFDNIKVDGTQENYEKVFIPKKNYCKCIIYEFDTKFKLIPDNIKKEYRDELVFKYKNIIDKAYNDIIIKATQTVDYRIARTRKFEIKDDNTEGKSIILSGKTVSNECIVKNIEEYYNIYKELIKDQFHLVVDEKTKAYDNSIEKIKIQLEEINEITQKKLKLIDTNIQELVNEPNNFNIENIINQLPCKTRDIKLDLLVCKTNNKTITLEELLSYAYDDKIKSIDNKHTSYNINTINSICYLEKGNTIEIPTYNIILKTIANSIMNNSILLQNIQNIIKKYLMKYTLQMDDIAYRYNENIYKQLYNLFKIEYCKLHISTSSNKLKWIIGKLGIKSNVLIPKDELPKELSEIIKYSITKDNIIFIEYDNSSEDEDQIRTYMIDKLYEKLMIIIIKN
jgi:hypothetical protein